MYHGLHDEELVFEGLVVMHRSAEHDVDEVWDVGVIVFLLSSCLLSAFCQLQHFQPQCILSVYESL